MHSRTLVAVVLAAAMVTPVRAAAAPAADSATLLRVFLVDGTSLVSYGEPARVGDRVIFSMPTAATPNPPLHLVNLPLARVDWDRTSRYAATARASHYVETQAENDYAALSNDVASTLNEVAATAEPSQRLAIVQRARQTLADWPHTHYNYRAAEVRQLLGMLDEAIADLQASRSPGRFALTLSAFTDPPAIVEPLLPPPATPRDAIEQMLTAARSVDMSAERTSLLATAVAAIDRNPSALPSAWAAQTRRDAQAEIARELRLDRSYRTLSARMMALAGWRAKQADVRGIERVLTGIQRRDALLGNKRPEAVNSLIDAVRAKLDAARQLQLARDRYALRAPMLAQYRVAIGAPMDLFAQLKPALESVKELSGSGPSMLVNLHLIASRVVQRASAIQPPEELAAAHALLISAAQLAATAATIRREAALASSMTRAWDASSAAAGALMLGARARTDIQSLLKPPQLR
jgi:hypothetical protein